MLGTDGIEYRAWTKAPCGINSEPTRCDAIFRLISFTLVARAFLPLRDYTHANNKHWRWHSGVPGGIALDDALSMKPELTHRKPETAGASIPARHCRPERRDRCNRELFD